MAVTGKKFLIGCAIGCGTVLLIAIMAIVGFSIWLNSEKELLQPQSLLGSDTQGYAEWTLDLEDPGTRGFVEAALDALQSVPNGSDQLPPWMEQWMQQRQSKKAREDVMKLFPSVIAWTATPGESPGEDLHLITASIKPLGNRLVLGDMIMGWFAERTDGVGVEEYGDERIYEFAMGEDRSLAMFIRGADLFFTSDVPTARTAVDRLSRTVRDEPPSELDGLFRATEGRGALRAALSNRDGQLARLWERFNPTPSSDSAADLWTRLRSATISGGLQAGGSFDLELLFRTPDAAWAAEHGEALADQLRGALSGLELPVEIEQSATGDQLRIELHMPDLVQAIGEGARRLEQGAGGEDASRIRIRL